MGIKAVIFDVGGVITDSPIHAIGRYERDHGISPNAINHSIVDAGAEGAWSRLERGELALEDFFEPFEADCRGAGLSVDGRRMMEYVAEAGVVRPQMVEAIRRIRQQGLKVAALTNVWSKPEDTRNDELRELFTVFIESSVVGLRKPDPRIYELVCGELEVQLDEAAFLDDIGLNLKAARALGMVTIKVDDPDLALRELQALLGFPLL
jgi:putative hydrolase of the HAD superfamily